MAAERYSVCAPLCGCVGIGRKGKFPWKQPRRPQQPGLRSWLLRHSQCCSQACLLRRLRVQTRRQHQHALMVFHSPQMQRTAFKQPLFHSLLTTPTHVLQVRLTPDACQLLGSCSGYALSQVRPFVPTGYSQDDSLGGMCARFAAPRRRRDLPGWFQWRSRCLLHLGSHGPCWPQPLVQRCTRRQPLCSDEAAPTQAQTCPTSDTVTVIMCRRPIASCHITTATS